jgi:hypothetical protein
MSGGIVVVETYLMTQNVNGRLIAWVVAEVEVNLNTVWEGGR